MATDTDFTYIKLVTGDFVYVAFVIDAYAGAIIGWEAAGVKQTRFVESAIRQAAALRRGRRAAVPVLRASDPGGWRGCDIRWNWRHGFRRRNPFPWDGPADNRD